MSGGWYALAEALIVGMAVAWTVRLAGVAGRRVRQIPGRLVGITGRAEFSRDTRAAIMAGIVPGLRARCRNCWWRRADHADHVIPASWGGSPARWNGRPLCARCNTRRGASMTLPEVVWLLVPGPADWPVWLIAGAWWVSRWL